MQQRCSMTQLAQQRRCISMHPGSWLHAMKLLNSNQNVEAFSLLFRPNMFEKEIVPFARCTKGSKLNRDGERRLWSLFLAAQRHRLRPEQQLKLLCARMHLEGNLWFATFATLPSSPYTLALSRCCRSDGEEKLAWHCFCYVCLGRVCVCVLCLIMICSSYFVGVNQYCFLST